MNSFFTPQNIFDVFMTLGGIAFIVAQSNIGWKKKKTNEDSDALTTIKIKDLTIETLQKENVETREKVQKQGERIAVLEAENGRLQLLIQNRNPELESFMKLAQDSLKSIIDTNKVILQSIEQMLKHDGKSY